MQFTIAYVLAALPFLVSSAPVDAPAEARKLTVGLTKRSRLTHESGAVDMAAVKTHVSRTSAKIQHGFVAFQRNTGVPHPLAAPVTASSKRATGSDQLMDDHEELWYGTISVGTPAVAFTGKFRLSCSIPKSIADPPRQWTLTRARATCSFPVHLADQLAPDTPGTTRRARLLYSTSHSIIPRRDCG
jgi:hypothetical protein